MVKLVRLAVLLEIVDDEIVDDEIDEPEMVPPVCD